MSNPLTLLKRYCLNQLPEYEFILIRNSKDLYNFFENEGIGSRQIPGRKIFHSFLKTNSSFTILRTNYDPRGSVFHSLNKESEFYHKTQKCGGVLHMFAAEISGLMGLVFNANKYLGFCIFRKDGTVLDSLISKHIIIRENDTYAFLVPQVTKNIPILPGISRAITGFPYVEKDRKGIMCAQVSLAIIADYWNTNNSELNFTASTAAEINRTVNLPNSNAGMSPKKMIDFFEIVDVANLDRKTMENEYKPHVNIYGYLESKFPVLCGIETEDEPHAFVVIGHTFDRNDWMAIADLAYFEKPLSGEKGAYHSNLT
jgi:hypothetical protein